MKSIKLSIFAKLAIAFGLAVLCFIAVAGFAAYGLTEAKALTDEIIELQEFGELVNELNISTYQARLGLAEYIISGEQVHKDKIVDAQDKIQENISIVQGGTSYLELAGKVAATIQTAITVDRLIGETITAYEANPDDANSILELQDELNRVGNSVGETGGTAIAAPLDTLIQERVEVLQQQVTTMRVISIVVTVVGIFVSVGEAYWISSGIIKSVTHLTDAANEIGRGNLDVEIKLNTGDEMEVLGEAVERMRTSLKLAVERLRTRK